MLLGYQTFGNTFSDNDSLAALISIEMNAQLLVLLTDVQVQGNTALSFYPHVYSLFNALFSSQLFEQHCITLLPTD